MRHAGADCDALRSTVGAAAALTVEDGRDGTPRLRRWKAHPRAAVSPPVRHFEPQLPYPLAVAPTCIRRGVS